MSTPKIDRRKKQRSAPARAGAQRPDFSRRTCAAASYATPFYSGLPVAHGCKRQRRCVGRRLGMLRPVLVLVPERLKVEFAPLSKRATAGKRTTKHARRPNRKSCVGETSPRLKCRGRRVAYERKAAARHAQMILNLPDRSLPIANANLSLSWRFSGKTFPKVRRPVTARLGCSGMACRRIGDKRARTFARRRLALDSRTDRIGAPRDAQAHRQRTLGHGQPGACAHQPPRRLPGADDVPRDRRKIPRTSAPAT